VKPVPEAALGAVRDTLREHGEPVAAGATTFMQARTANEVLKAQERRVRLQRMKGELVDRAKAVAQARLSCATQATRNVSVPAPAQRPFLFILASGMITVLDGTSGRPRA
jgi:hypothetical protein